MEDSASTIPKKDTDTKTRPWIKKHSAVYCVLVQVCFLISKTGVDI